jgi:8-oxo-dGTP pyrophosphatase MutT (NUDIX family)
VPAPHTSPAPTVTDEQAAWYASLPAFTGNAAALFTNADGAVLLVKPSYKPHWSLPGGVMEAHESPRACCRREVAEELDLAIDATNLLVLDWYPPASHRRGMFCHIFDAGTLHNPDSIRLQDDELDDAAFHPLDKALLLLSPSTGPRTQAALEARRLGHPLYLEQGQPTGPETEHNTTTWNC